jgi:hypothetical protein
VTRALRRHGTIVLFVVLLAGAACQRDEAGTVTGSPAERGPALVALLLDNTLLRVRLSDGEVTAKASLGPAADGLFPGRYLATGDEGRLLVLARRSDAAADEVAVIDATTLAVRSRHPLEERVQYQGIVLAPSGVLYAYGNRRRVLLDKASDAWSQDAVVTAVDPASGSVLATTTVRRAAGRDWWAYWGALSNDGNILVLSYHGGCGPGFFQACTTGADRLVVSAEGLRRCRGGSRDVGCLTDVHGSVAAHGDGFLAATGTPEVLELDEAGAVVGSFKVNLDAHVMQIAASGPDLYAVGSCDQGGGLSALDLRTEALETWTGTYVCGERLAAGPGDEVALAANVGATPLAAPSRLVVVDASTGRELRAVRTEVGVLDLAFVP